MPKVDPKAVLEVEEIRQARAAAKAAGPLAWALIEWLYTNGARASEPGMARLRDIDLRNQRVALVHLKGGLKRDWVALATPCKAALDVWLPIRPTYIKTPEQQDFIFPSARPGRKCEFCRGSGRLPARAKKPERPCHHCEGQGVCWGLSRIEVRDIVGEVLTAAGMAAGLRHPHVLRHSLVTHLLDKGMHPATIRERVGHRQLESTLSYVKATKAARAQLDAALMEEDGEDE